MPLHAPALLALALALGSAAAQAHKPSDAYLQLRLEGAHVDQRFDIALRDLDRELALDADGDGVLTWREVRTREQEIDTLATTAVRLQADGRDCRAEAPDALQLDEHSDGRYAVLQRRWVCPAAVRQLGVTYGLFADSDPTHRGLVRLQAEGRTAAAVLTAGPAVQALPAMAAASGEASDEAGSAGFASFVQTGIHHILAGFDHLLFLAALLLPAVFPRRGEAARPLTGVLADVLRVVTSFTEAHSLTLALATFGLADPPARLVETLIAASVALAAAANLMPRPPAWLAHDRWKLTFAFGLVHGFGFASALRDTGLGGHELAMPLLGFNLGVELGQLAVVACTLPLAWMLRRVPGGPRVALQGGSAAIVVLGLGWCIERAFALGPVGFL